MKTAPTVPFWHRPSTRLGWWAVGLGAVYIVMMVINNGLFMNLAEDVPWRRTILPFYGIAMMLCGVASGITSLVALWRGHERSGMVWFTFLIGTSALIFLVGELLVPH